MAEPGPLVRVDTDGRGTLIKMTRKEADVFLASHTGSKVVAMPPPPSDIVEMPGDKPAKAKQKAV